MGVGGGGGPIILDEVQCSGNEKLLSECPHNRIISNNCDHDEDAGVLCLSGIAICNIDDTLKLIMMIVMLYKICALCRERVQ